MGIFEIILIGISLSMDAFAASVCKGLSIKKNTYKTNVIIALYFGIFQAVMPLIGYLLASTFQNILFKIDHWIAFVLLSIIGIKMIIDSFDTSKEKIDAEIGFKSMLILSIATSIDALAIGITFAFFEINILLTVIIIGIITFLLSFIGVKIGNKFGIKFQNKAEILGGIILILIGTKILLEHLGILVF